MATQQSSSQDPSGRTSATGSPRAAATPPSSSSRWGRLLPLGILAVGLLELTILVLIGINTSLWWSVLIIAVGWVIGIALVVAAGQQSFVRLRSLLRAVRGRGDVQDHLSRPAFTLLSALFFFFPGLVTDLIGLVLLLTPVQRRSVRAMGLGSGSAGARTVLYKRSGTGVIDGEIVLENRSSREDGDQGTPPTLIQD